MNPMKFSEMSYTRPDIDALLGQCKALAAKAAGAASGKPCWPVSPQSAP